MEEFYTRLEKILISQNKTRADLSRAINVTQASIIGWKNGSMPNAKQIIKMSEYLNVTCDYLLTGKDEGLLPPQNMLKIEDVKNAFKVAQDLLHL